MVPALAYLRASAAMRRFLDRGERLAGGFLSAALTPDEKSELGIRLYDASPLHRGVGLFDWERAWLARRLPPAPARVLVGACGAGREVLALVDAGYAVDAFEPARALCDLAGERAAARARVLRFRYQELSAAVLDGADGPAAALAHERYDAVLLGWGSLTHVLDAGERARLLSALDRLCPRGPILASFWCDDALRAAPVVGRAERWGRASGRALARLRRLAIAPAPRESFIIGGGFAYRFTAGEIAALARAVGRDAVWDDDAADYPHVTFAKP